MNNAMMSPARVARVSAARQAEPLRQWRVRVTGDVSAAWAAARHALILAGVNPGDSDFRVVSGAYESIRRAGGIGERTVRIAPAARCALQKSAVSAPPLMGHLPKRRRQRRRRVEPMVAVTAAVVEPQPVVESQPTSTPTPVPVPTVLTCGAPTKKGSPCKIRVRAAGGRCRLHVEA